MPASDEIQQAAAKLRKAAQLKRDELRNAQTQLGRAKDDNQRTTLALQQELNTLSNGQRPADSRLAAQLLTRNNQINDQLNKLTGNHHQQIGAMEKQIRDAEQAISQFESQAADLERQRV